MDWKLVIGFDDVLFLKNYNKGDYRKRETELGDAAASKSVQLDQLQTQIENLQWYESEAEYNKDEEAERVLYRLRCKVMLKRDLVLDEYRRLRNEQNVESWKNRQLYRYYKNRNDCKADQFEKKK